MKDLEIALEIIDTTASYCKVPFEAVVGTCRKRELVKARHISMYFIDMFINDTLDNKGSIFGKSHDDIIFARYSVNNQASIYRDYRNGLEVIRQRILDQIDDGYKFLKNYDTDKT